MLDRWKNYRIIARKSAGMALLLVLSGCAVVPKPAAPPPPPLPIPTNVLPTDKNRHRVALLVPLSGADSHAGRSIANAATMALLDTGTQNLRITTYDTSLGAPEAAARAVADGNRLILGPLLGRNALAVAQTARAAHLPVISFSNDVDVAGDQVFVMGDIPSQSIVRVIRYARATGSRRFAALIPVGNYGDHTSAAILKEVHDSGGVMVGMESYNRANGTITAAVRRLRAHGPIDAVLIADSAGLAVQAAPLIRQYLGSPRILGTELWSGERIVAHTPALDGALFAAMSDQRFHRFATSYKTRFGTDPYRIATLGYDSVLLTLRVAKNWPAGARFPTAKLYDSSGFLGLDGVFRFGSNEVIDRALEVREVHAGTINVVSSAPSSF